MSNYFLKYLKYKSKFLELNHKQNGGDKIKKLNLQSIDKKNYQYMMLLDPGEEGKKYVAENSYTLLQAIFDGNLDYVKGIYLGKTPIGLIYYYPIDKKSMFINRFMIDEKYQGKGFGKKALKLSLQYFISKYSPNILKISSSNPIALELYKNFGFIDKNDKEAKDFYSKYKQKLLILDLDEKNN